MTWRLDVALSELCITTITTITATKYVSFGFYLYGGCKENGLGMGLQGRLFFLLSFVFSILVLGVLLDTLFLGCLYLCCS
jgi:hypothetical protein